MLRGQLRLRGGRLSVSAGRVSGATVDKAHAVIGKNASGVVFYFENEQNLAAYVEPTM